MPATKHSGNTIAVFFIERHRLPLRLRCCRQGFADGRAFRAVELSRISARDKTTVDDLASAF
jgi:hypothetical protein